MGFQDPIFWPFLSSFCFILSQTKSKGGKEIHMDKISISGPILGLGQLYHRVKVMQCIMTFLSNQHFFKTTNFDIFHSNAHFCHLLFFLSI